MVGKNRQIKIIKSYENLKSCSSWELVLIKGRTELVIGSSNMDLIKVDGVNHETLAYTLSLEGDYIVQNNYSSYNKNGKRVIAPTMKISFKIGADNPLERRLLGMAKHGELL